MKISEIGEAQLLGMLRQRLGAASPGVLVGVGDDAAVHAPFNGTVVSCADMLVQGVDFDFAWATWADVGHKAAAVNLSDLAAMAARPRGVLLSLALRPDDVLADVLSLIDSLAAVAAEHGAPLVGGDLSATEGPLVVAVTALGEAPENHVLRRNHAQPGDIILVSGALGGSGAALRALQAGHKISDALAARQLRPTPQVALGMALGASGKVRSAADISDGLARDSLHLPAVGCSVRIDVQALPIAEETRAVAQALGLDAISLALGGGEDFELVLAADPNGVQELQQIAANVRVPLSIIGQITPKTAPEWLNIGDSELFSFDHFKK